MLSGKTRVTINVFQISDSQQKYANDQITAGFQKENSRLLCVDQWDLWHVKRCVTHNRQIFMTKGQI